MAQLNDTMVQGDLRVTGTMYGTLSGNATTANNATNDSDGSKINTTYLKRSGGELTGTITRAFASSSSSTVSETSILEVTGSTDGFKITYQASTADLGITRFGTTDDANAKLSLGNWTSSSTYKEAISIVNGSATVTGSLSGNASTATTATYSDSTKVTTAATTKGYLTAANASGYSSGSSTTLFVDTGVYISTNTGELVATSFTGTNLSISGPSALQGGVGISIDNTKALTVIDARSTTKPSIFSVGIVNSNPQVTLNSSLISDSPITATELTASGAITAGGTGTFASLKAATRYADGSITSNNSTSITWSAGATDLLLTQNGTSKVTVDMTNLLVNKVYWLHSGRAREVELTAALSGWTIYIYDTVYSSLTSGAKIPLQDNIKSTMHHGQFSVAIIRTDAKTFYAIMSYGETSKEHEYGYNHYTTSMAYSDQAYTFYRIASFNLPDVGVTECLLTLRLSFILTYVQFGYMPTDYTDIEVVLGVRQENTTSYQTWVSRRQTYIKGTSTQINNAKISVGTYSDNGKTKIYIALVVPAHTSVYSRYLADFAYYASAGVLEYNPAAYTSTAPSGYTEKDSTAIQ